MADILTHNEIEIYRDVIKRPIIDGISILDWLKEQILKSPDETIRIKTADIKRVLGPEFEKKDDMKIYEGMKAALFFEHPFEPKEAIIGVRSGKTIEGDNLLIMYYAYYPELPPSLKELLK